MARDSKDTRTGLLPGVAKRPVGRPPTGDAMSAAERQKRRRERLAEAGQGFLNVKLSVDVLQALDAHVKFKDLDKGMVIEKLIRSQLLRKR